jgi:hypothetical protein
MIDYVLARLLCKVGSLRVAKSFADGVTYKRPAIQWLLSVALCAFAPAPLFANGPNLLTNPTFDSGLEGWSYFINNPPAVRVATWEPSDADGSIASGSIKLTTSYDIEVKQCVPVVGGTPYLLAAKAWIPSGSPPTLQAAVYMAWYDNTDCSGGGGGPANGAGRQGKWLDLRTNGVAPSSARSAGIFLDISYSEPLHSVVSVYFDNIFFGTGTCAPSSTRLCLNQGRFQVEATWATGDQGSGPGMAVPFAADSGSFWFFSPTNIELDVKVLDACVPSLGNHYWVFAAGLTTVQVVLTVTDTKTGVVRTYTNPQGTAFQPITDTSAFGTCP